MDSMLLSSSNAPTMSSPAVGRRGPRAPLDSGVYNDDDDDDVCGVGAVPTVGGDRLGAEDDVDGDDDDAAICVSS